MSLDTRCPKEALRLARVLEYHTAEILKHLQATGMEYSEIVKRVRDYWAEILTRRKAGIDQSGLLSPSKVRSYQGEIENAEDMIANNWPEDELAYTDGSIITPTQHLLNRLGLSIPESDPSYDQFKKEGYYGMAWFFRELLKYNDTYRDSIYGNQAINPQVIEVTAGQANDKQSPLKEAVHEYLQNIKGDDLASRTLEEREDQLNLLMEILGEGYNLFSLDIRQAAKVKEILRVIPKNRSKNKDIRDLSLQQQLQVPDVERLSVGSINKYLACYGAFLKWGHIHGLSNPNSFEGMALKDSRGKKKRDSFQLSQVTMMLEELAKRENGLANQEYQYWGALLLLYTGARLNEIASLTVDDVIEKDGIWYFDINDEEEQKSLKTDAAKRIVPVHSDLIELGFLDFLQKAKDMHDVMFVGVPKGVNEMIMSPMHEKEGDKFSYTFTVPGTYQFHCHPHEKLGMKGTLIVGTPSKPGETVVMDHHKMGKIHDDAMTKNATKSEKVASTGPQGTGKVNEVDVQGHKVNITHNPIAALGWPKMKMEFPVDPSVNLDGIKAGDAVSFTLKDDGNEDYTVTKIQKN